MLKTLLNYLEVFSFLPRINFMQLHRHSILRHTTSDQGTFLAQYVNSQTNDVTYLKVVALHIAVNEGTFSLTNTGYEGIRVQMVQTEALIESSCNCEEHRPLFCEHQLLVITAIARREEFAIFFQKTKRLAQLKQIAKEYGLENEENLEAHFWITLQDRTVVITPKLPGLLRISTENLKVLAKDFMPAPLPHRIDNRESTTFFVVLRRHKYYHHLQLGLYQAAVTKQGKIKSPLLELNVSELAWQAPLNFPLPFLLAINHFQQLKENALQDSDLLALKAMIDHAGTCSFYTHLENRSEQVVVSSLEAITLKQFEGRIVISVVEKEQIRELSLKIEIEGQRFSNHEIVLRFGCFLVKESTYYLLTNRHLANIIEYFGKQFDPLRIHISKFPQFQEAVLDSIQDFIQIEYPADQQVCTTKAIQNQLAQITDKRLYLSEAGSYVHLTPVMSYGEMEIPVRSKRLLYDRDEKDRPYYLSRNEEKEQRFIELVIKQHPDLIDQLTNSLPYFYLPKSQFLEEHWFLQAFEDWRAQGIDILGFNAIEGNKLNAHKAKVNIVVTSGINWFNADLDVRFGKQKAKLKNLHAAVVAKRKYVALDDGTLGLLPSEWLERFRQFFETGEVTPEDTLQIPWVNFSAVEKHFDQEMFEESTYNRLQEFKKQLVESTTYTPVAVPVSFQGTLRPYQEAGFNWLYFLDQLHFGGCLADDMGLGKSAQVIALLLATASQNTARTNLIVVPTSLLYNWQAELRKFAPSLTVLVYNGQSRSSLLPQLSTFDVVLISYHLVVSDCNYLKKIVFDRIILDESHYIKNPETQRYKAVNLLQARNRFVMTGTPIENHTFDIYSQLSFACPGLLGSKRAFKALFSTPIDQFKDSARASELQQKISPFVLRRTKNEVAKELPDKSEIVLYCEMPDWQRKIYDAHEKSFREFIDTTSGEELRRESMHVLKGLTQLRQLCNAPVLVDNVQVPEGARSSKINLLVEKIKELAVDHKILVFSQFVSMLELIEQALAEEQIGCSKLTGATRNREMVIKQFKEQEEKRVFLISLKAGGTGLNLTEADYVFLVDPWWNPAVEAQAIDRVHRIGQDKKVIAVRLICPNTIEEKMSQMQEGKRQLANQLIDENAATTLASFQKEDLLALLR